jgi:hypothetical protein
MKEDIIKKCEARFQLCDYGYSTCCLAANHKGKHKYKEENYTISWKKNKYKDINVNYAWLIENTNIKEVFKEIEEKYNIKIDDNKIYNEENHCMAGKEYNLYLSIYINEISEKELSGFYEKENEKELIKLDDLKSNIYKLLEKKVKYKKDNKKIIKNFDVYFLIFNVYGNKKEIEDLNNQEKIEENIQLKPLILMKEGIDKKNDIKPNKEKVEKLIKKQLINPNHFRFLIFKVKNIKEKDEIIEIVSEIYKEIVLVLDPNVKEEDFIVSFNNLLKEKEKKILIIEDFLSIIRNKELSTGFNFGRDWIASFNFNLMCFVLEKDYDELLMNAPNMIPDLWDFKQPIIEFN